MPELNDQNFEKEVTASQKPVLVDFFASWCNPCSVLGPILEKISKDFEGRFVLFKANLDNVPITAQKFNVDVIPTVVLFKEGKPVDSFVGLQTEQVIKKWLEGNLGENENNKDIEKMVAEYAEYAKKNGFQLNPNKEVVNKIIKGLLENEKKYGAKYCPCRRVTGNLEEDKLKICPCVYHKEEIGRLGHCLCGLFVK
ncbi:MAG: thioredoxin [bacterium]|nr:thioredoxin [bacterium]